MIDDFGRTIAAAHSQGWGTPSGPTCDASPIGWFMSDSPDVDHIADLDSYDRTTTEEVSTGRGRMSIAIKPYPALNLYGLAQGYATTQEAVGPIPCTAANEALLEILVVLGQAPTFPPTAPDGDNSWANWVEVSFEGNTGGGASVSFLHQWDQVTGDSYVITFNDDDAADSVVLTTPFAGDQTISFDRSTSRGTTRITTTATGTVELPLVYFTSGEDQPYVVRVAHEASASAHDASETDPTVGYLSAFSLAVGSLDAHEVPVPVPVPLPALESGPFIKASGGAAVDWPAL